MFTSSQVLLDFGAQPLMLEELAIEGLGLTKDMLEMCPWTISISMGRTEHANSITRNKLEVQICQDGVENATYMKAKAIVTQANSYDILVGAMVLYPMDFILDFREETIYYRSGWQARDGRKAHSPTRFD